MTLLVSSVDGVWRIAGGGINDGSRPGTTDDGVAYGESSQSWQSPSIWDCNNPRSRTRSGEQDRSVGQIEPLTEGER